jgi:HSP20 family protein
LADRLNQAFDWDRESFSGWHPPVDIYEDKDGVVLKAELPGMKKEDIDVRVENNVLTMNGQRKREQEVKEDGYFRSERAYGSFSRSFSLPTTVDVKKINASYKEGVLTVQLPKLEEAKPKQIDVKVA